MIHVRIEECDDPVLALVGAAVARRGDTLAVVVSTRVSWRQATAAVLELVDDGERDALRSAFVAA